MKSLFKFSLGVLKADSASVEVTVSVNSTVIFSLRIIRDIWLAQLNLFCELEQHGVFFFFKISLKYVHLFFPGFLEIFLIFSD